MGTDPVAAVEQEARARHARFNPALWQELLEGPGARLAQGLAEAPVAHANAVLSSWLRLAAEGVGLGLLSTASPPPNVSSLLMVHLAPAQLPALHPASRLAALAQAWNLGEALAQEPGWRQALFLRLCREARLDALPGLVDDVEQRVAAAAPRRAGATAVSWVFLAADDPRFLPGALHFVAPTICCVHDRRRLPADGERAIALGVWLEGEVVVLGPTGCADRAAPEVDPALVEDTRGRDVRVEEVVGTAANDFRAALTLDTSQFLVAVMPA